MMGHVTAIRQAIEDDVETLLILEDDAAPVADLADRWKALQDPLSSLPWDWLYLGGQIVGRRPEDVWVQGSGFRVQRSEVRGQEIPNPKSQIPNAIVRPFGPVWRCHAYMIRRGTMQQIVRILPYAAITIIDKCYGALHTEPTTDVLCTWPWLFGVRREESDTEGEVRGQRSGSRGQRSGVRGQEGCRLPLAALNRKRVKSG
jgi:hypothetical protein